MQAELRIRTSEPAVHEMCQFLRVSELNKWPAFAVRDKELGRFDGGYHDLLSARQLLARWVFRSAKDSDLALSLNGSIII